MSDVFKAIAEKFNMSRPAVSKHLKVLQESQLAYTASDSSDGRQRNCYAQLEALVEVNNYLAQLQEFWQSRLDNLDSFLAKRSKAQKAKD